MKTETIVLLGLGLWFAVMLYLEVAFRRSFRRTDIFMARLNHRKALSQAQYEGEGSLLFHTMQCTICGEFHAEDDSECPTLDELR